jgi:hypothetical protein
VDLSREFGLTKTARVLRLDYYGLKKRSILREPKRAPAFVELQPPEHSNTGTAGECVIELEDGLGAKLRVHLKGVDKPDLAWIGVLIFGVRSQDDYRHRHDWGQGRNPPIAAGVNG